MTHQSPVNFRLLRALKGEGIPAPDVQEPPEDSVGRFVIQEGEEGRARLFVIGRGNLLSASAQRWLIGEGTTAEMEEALAAITRDGWDVRSRWDANTKAWGLDWRQTLSDSLEVASSILRRRQEEETERNRELERVLALAKISLQVFARALEERGFSVSLTGNNTSLYVERHGLEVRKSPNAIHVTDPSKPEKEPAMRLENAKIRREEDVLILLAEWFAGVLAADLNLVPKNLRPT